ncbi:hypothetical protein DFJ73DRAFT_818227 [Zopfochytrium polystomum]|nr:hypothetical protein DFJ73DRAFT_818227 [Zopfochytrium polystomum]
MAPVMVVVVVVVVVEAAKNEAEGADDDEKRSPLRLGLLLLVLVLNDVVEAAAISAGAIGGDGSGDRGERARPMSLFVFFDD